MKSALQALSSRVNSIRYVPTLPIFKFSSGASHSNGHPHAKKSQTGAKGPSESKVPKLRVLVPIADGSEEIEATAIIDVLRRAGAQVTVASVGTHRTVVASRQTKLEADVLIQDCLSRPQPYDGIFLPGGMPGAENLRDCAPLIQLLKAQAAADRWYGGICASPAVVLQPHKLLDGLAATCHPSFASKLPADTLKQSRVVVHKNCVTSQAPGTSLEFALQVVACLYGVAHAQRVAAPMCLHFEPTATTLFVQPVKETKLPDSPTHNAVVGAQQGKGTEAPGQHDSATGSYQPPTPAAVSGTRTDEQAAVAIELEDTAMPARVASFSVG